MSAPFNSYSDLAEEGEAYKRSLMTWFGDHGRQSKKPRTEHEIALKEKRLAWVEKILELLYRASRKQEEAQ